MNAPIACAFGFVEHVDGCPEPAGYRLTIRTRRVEAFACRRHLADAKAAAAVSLCAYTVERVDRARRPA